MSNKHVIYFVIAYFSYDIEDPSLKQRDKMIPFQIFVFIAQIFFCHHHKSPTDVWFLQDRSLQEYQTVFGNFHIWKQTKWAKESSFPYFTNHENSPE